MRFVLALIVAGIPTWMSPAPVRAAEVLRTAVTVRVYQNAGLPSEMERRALAEAEAVLGRAFVDVSWRRCNGPSSSTVCNAPPGLSELSLRILHGEAEHHRTASLGEAFVNRLTGGGVLATVYFDRVAQLANATGTDPAVLLGRAAAHELGHLLMRTPAHANRGLMRPHWTPWELRRNQAADWAFTSGDVVAIRRSGPAQ